VSEIDDRIRREKSICFIVYFVVILKKYTNIQFKKM